MVTAVAGRLGTQLEIVVMREWRIGLLGAIGGAPLPITRINKGHACHSGN